MQRILLSGIVVILLGALAWFFPLKKDSFKKKALNVQVSIKPIHSLTSFISQGVFNPSLLMAGHESAHTQSLTPQQLHALKTSDLVIWIGPSYESLWQKPLAQLPKEQVVTLLESQGLILYPYREQDDKGSYHHHPNHHHHDSCAVDGHIWLDPENAKVLAQRICKILTEMDPAHGAVYQKNLTVLLTRLDQLKQKLDLQFGPVKNKTYMIYHDGLQYFDRRFGFKMQASLVQEPDLPPQAGHLLALKRFLLSVPPNERPVCIFSEPAFMEKISENLAKEFHLFHQKIDYIGQNIPAGPEAYFLMMDQLAEGFMKGLSS